VGRLQADNVQLHAQVVAAKDAAETQGSCGTASMAQAALQEQVPKIFQSLLCTAESLSV
jgi:hypothetical protein